MTKTMSPKQRRKLKRTIFRRRVLLCLLLASIVISICLFTPFFNIKTIEIIGNENITAEEITAIAGIPEGLNIFKVRKRPVKKAVLQIPEIETVKIRRKLPSKIQLEVTETRAIMQIPYMTGYVTANEFGRIMSIKDTQEESNLLLITGLEIKNAEICKKISVQDTVTFDIILETIQKLCNAGLQPEIKSCHFDNLSNVFMYLTDGTKIIFGKTNDMDYKISILLNILPKVDRTEGAYIDLTTPSHSIYGILDPTPVPEPSASPEASVEGEATAPPEESAPPATTAEPANENH